MARKTNTALAYGFQRVHAALQTGDALTVQQQRQEPVRVFMQQSTLDGACGVHVLAMLLVIFDLAKASALQEMRRRKCGVVAEVWKAFAPTYFTGIHAKEWVALVNSLGLPLALTAKYEVQDDVDRHAVEWLMRGHLVALAFASVKHQRTKHWALAVGIEGLVSGKTHHAQRLLLLDPSGNEPSFQACNARLRLTTSVDERCFKRQDEASSNAQLKPAYWLHESDAWSSEMVRLLAVVRVRRRP